VEEGEFVGFIGPNGAGKTTTIKMMSGVLNPTSGHLKVLDYLPIKRQKEFLKQIAFVMGNKTQLWWDLPAMESFRLLKTIYEIPEKTFNQSFDMLSHLLGISELLDIQVRKLSLGERMKCEIMAALIHMPRILFLDEPTLGLDIAAQKAIRGFFRKYNESTNATVILTSHYLEDIKALCDRIIFINKGRIMYDGPFSELSSKYANKVMLRCTFNSVLSDQKLQELAEYGPVESNTNNIRITLEIDRIKTPEIASLIAGSYPIQDILIEEIPLETIIEQMY
jgi:ABC-2 type transport system ATP-binding protein